MHVNIRHRFNQALGKEGLYYRLKESYRDVRGNVHSLIILNVGFVPELDANQMRRIAYALTDRFKTDLSLRPIYHQKDNRSDAHLFFGLLAYWVVNTIRYELKQNGINCYWTEIVRRMSTQKLVTTEGINPPRRQS